MTASRFPDPRRTSGDIVAFGDDLSPETLVDAYRHAIFPWPMEGVPLPWFCPRERAILRFDALRISKSLERSRRRNLFSFSIDRDFRGVIRGCAEARRPDQGGTWIFPPVAEAYIRLHELGLAHSAEVWEGDELVGGIYGVDAGGVFNGESMFYNRSNASKLALLHLIDHLRENGLDWLDIQVMSPHMELMGATLLGRADYLDLFDRTRSRGLVLFP